MGRVGGFEWDGAREAGCVRLILCCKLGRQTQQRQIQRQHRSTAPSHSVRSSPFSLLISLHLDQPPISNKFTLLIFPDGFPTTTGFHWSFAAVAVGPPSSPLTPRSTPSGITCTFLQRVNTAINPNVKTKSTPATAAAKICAPRARVRMPEIAVAAAARKKPRAWDAKKAAQMRGKEE